METAQAQARSNTQVVQRCYGYFGQGNIPALLNELTDDIVWTSPGPADILPWVGVRKGKGEVADFFTLVNEHIEFEEFEPRQFIAENDKVVTLGYWESKSRKTGRTSKSNWAMVFTFRNGKVCNFEEYADTWAGVEAFR